MLYVCEGTHKNEDPSVFEPRTVWPLIISSDKKQQRELQIHSSLAWNLSKPGLKTTQPVKFDIYRALFGVLGVGKCTGYTQEVSYFKLSSRKCGRVVCVCVSVCLVKEV